MEMCGHCAERSREASESKVELEGRKDAIFWPLNQKRALAEARDVPTHAHAQNTRSATAIASGGGARMTIE